MRLLTEGLLNVSTMWNVGDINVYTCSLIEVPINQTNLTNVSPFFLQRYLMFPTWNLPGSTADASVYQFTYNCPSSQMSLGCTWIRDELVGKSKSDWRKSWRSVEEWFNKNCRYYPPGNYHIPPWEKENHLQKASLGGYVSSLEGTQLLNYYFEFLFWWFMVWNRWALMPSKLQRWQAVLQGVSCERCWIRRRSWGAPDETPRHKFFVKA